MTVTSRVRNRITDAINMAFSAVGVSADTCSPQSRDNKAPIAWEYFIAGHLTALASGRFKKAKADAIKAGILFDHDEHPKPTGMYEPLYDGEHIAIELEVKRPSQRVNASKMSEYLVAKGVSPKLLADATEFATSTNRAAHVFTAYIKSDDG